MKSFEKQMVHRIAQFEAKLYKTSTVGRWSKSIQQKVDGIIPHKFHTAMATALEKGVKAFLEGLHIMHKEDKHSFDTQDDQSLQYVSTQAKQVIDKYKKIASVEGAGTGYGGFIAATIDFPALISIKLKLLQELCLLFGYRLDSFEERLFVLRIVQLQFSGQSMKQRLWKQLKAGELVETNDWQSWEDFDWEEFYMEYKQSIELRKLFQMIPGFGAVVGAWANYTFIEELGDTAVLCYQVRRLHELYGKEAF